jgi:hypothetical protein
MDLSDRQKRVVMRVPVEVRGEDVRGTRFTEIGQSVNVSGGGILFESNRQLAVGARLFLSIELPPMLRRHFGGTDAYRARAVVCRVEPLDDRGIRRVGARFIGPADPTEVI